MAAEAGNDRSWYKSESESFSDAVYPIVFPDTIHLKMHQRGQVKNQAVHLALGINLDGYKELPGPWIGEHEGAKFWLNC